MNRKLFVLLLGCCALSSCRIHYRTEPKSSYGQGIVLAAKESEDGRTSDWRLYYDSSGAGSRIDRTESFTETTPKIGIMVGPVTRERAQAVGVEPFEGVWVTAVEPNSAAASVGISMGDILLSVNGVELTSREQFEDYYEQNAVVGEPMVLGIRVYRRQGEPIEPQKSASVELQPVGYDVRESSTDSIPLEGSAGILKYTGLRLASLPSELCEEIYGVSEERVIVSSVGSGSPAYYSGLRGGDRVLTCNGIPVQSLNELRAAVLLRLQLEGINGPLYDLAKLSPSEPALGAGSKVALEVDGPIGKHTAKLGVTDDLDDETEFFFPILMDYESDVDSAKLSFLDFIFQFGFNYSSRTRHSKTREPVETWELSMLPLGMFEIERGVSRNRYTLFWLIDWETKN